jgi:hypothetical protein
VLARTKIDSMSNEMRMLAAALLSPQQIFELNGGALGLIGEDRLASAFGSQPPLLRQIFEAEAKLRNELTGGNPVFNELERIAVLFGDFEDDGPRIPRNRWSLHPDGYFIRYNPQGYLRTVVQVYVPAKRELRRDDKGRIVYLSDGMGNSIETEYDDSMGVLDIEGNPNMKGHAFKRIVYKRPDPANPQHFQTAEWDNEGWTLVGLPGSAGEAANSRPASSLLTFLDIWGRAKDRAERVEKVKDWYDRGKDLRDSLERNRDNSRAVRDLTDVKHYEDGMTAATGADLTKKGEWIAKHTDIVTNAWRWAADMLAGGGGSKEVKPARGGAIPGSAGRQRIGVHLRSSN